MEWIDVDERLPKKGVCVDIYRPEDGRLTNYRLEGYGKNKCFSPVYGGYTCVRNATHWMPVPGHPIK